MADALSRKVETEVDLAAARPSGMVETAPFIYEDELDSQGGVLCMLSFLSLAWLTGLKTSYATSQQV